jgi:cytochrome P450
MDLPLADGPNVPPHVPHDLVRNFSARSDPRYRTEPYDIYRELADDAPPLFYTPTDYRGPGAWFVTTAAYAREVLQNPDPFCNAIRYGGDVSNYARRLVPLELDPPEHLKYRAVLAPLFSPRAIDSIEADINRLADDYIDAFARDGHVDFMKAFARPFPGTVFMAMMGMPMDRKDQFFRWEEEMFHGETDEIKRQAGRKIHGFFVDLIQEKRRNPADDIVTKLTTAQVDGERMSDDLIYDMAFLLYLAGLDTVNSGMGHIWRYLAEHPQAQAELRANPALVPNAVEELLRIHSWVEVSRVLKRDHDFHGVQMKAGDRVVVMSELPSWDPQEFPDPGKVDFHRPTIPHLAFGGGVHRCAGSHLARRELRIALAAWLRRIPEWRMEPGAKPTYFDTGNLALRALSLEWDGAQTC